VIKNTAHTPKTPKPKKGVESFDVSLEKQTVVVRGAVTPEAVLEVVRKTGKKAELA
jgi:copper chaperone CopZ